jgi:F0F1-type ATP synthase assembly protein I
MDDIAFNQNNEKFKECSFCGTPRTSVYSVVIGEEACICPNCIVATHKCLVEKANFKPQIKVVNDDEVFKPLKSLIILIIAMVVIMTALFFYYKK